METNQESTESNQLDSFQELASSLGFVETLNAFQLRSTISDLMIDGKPYEAEWSQYQQMAEESINNLIDEAFAKGQIGLMVMKALTYFKGGKQDDCAVELNHAFDYALNMGFSDITHGINKLSPAQSIEADNVRRKIKKL